MEPKDDGLPFLEKLGISAGKVSGKMQSFGCGDYFHQPTSRVEIYPNDMVKLLFFLVILVFEALFSDVMDFDVVLLEEKLRGEAPIKKETPA